VIEAEIHACEGAQSAYKPLENDWLEELFSGWGLSLCSSSLYH